jgi:hypothetical protein
MFFLCAIENTTLLVEAISRYHAIYHARYHSISCEEMCCQSNWAPVVQLLLLGQLVQVIRQGRCRSEGQDFRPRSCQRHRASAERTQVLHKQSGFVLRGLQNRVGQGKVPSSRYKISTKNAKDREQSKFTSPHLTSPHLTSPNFTLSNLTLPNLTSPHLTSPHLTSPHLTSPYLT